ncbi:MAG: hypothetical protein QNK37_08330 [Acidobacteriota bacterium]|nr:hypothetical protein [Acidobacteriota bacterium]
MTSKMDQLAAQVAGLQAQVKQLEQQHGGVTTVVAEIKKLLIDRGGARIVELNSARGALLGLSWVYAGRTYTLMPEDISEHGWRGQRAWLYAAANHAPLGLHGTLLVYSQSAFKIFRRSPALDPALSQRILAAARQAVQARPDLFDGAVCELEAVPAVIEALCKQPHDHPASAKPKTTVRTRTRRAKKDEAA